MGVCSLLPLRGSMDLTQVGQLGSQVPLSYSPSHTHFFFESVLSLELTTHQVG